MLRRKCVMLMTVFLFDGKAGAWQGLPPLEAMSAGGARCLVSPALRFSFGACERARGAHVNARMSGKGSKSEGKGRYMRIFCADKLEETALASMRSAGHKVIYQPEMEGEKLVAALAETSPHLLVVRSTKVPAAAISASKDLELVVRAGAGVDNIDLAAAAIAKVKVANCAGANADAVAELAMGLILACDRRIVAQDTLSKQSSWAKGLFGRSKGLKGRVLGIVGFGRIGRQVAQLAQAFGMSVVAWNRSPINPLPPGIQIAPSLLSLAAQSDVVSVHAAAAAGGPLLAADFFEAIKEGGIVVNLSRGGVLDEQALLAAIQTRGLLVGTDVYESEPGGNEVVKFENSLARHPSVVSTHHTAAATTQAQEAVGQVLLHVIHTYTLEDVVLNQVLL